MSAGKRGKRKQRLEATIAAIKRRWGPDAIRRLEQRTAGFPHISTAFPDLDNALAGISGVPRGRMTEILGQPTSGMTTLALKILANAQMEGDTAAYLDLGQTFDPDYAARCEVDLDRLLLVRPQNGLEALEIVHALVASRGLGVLVFDDVSHLLAEPARAQAMAALLHQIPPILAQSPCALIFLTPLKFGDAMSWANYPPGFAVPHYATVRLLIQRERWLGKGRDTLGGGYQAQARILKNKLGPAGQRVKIAVTFNGVVRGDGT